MAIRVCRSWTMPPGRGSNAIGPPMLYWRTHSQTKDGHIPRKRATSALLPFLSYRLTACIFSSKECFNSLDIIFLFMSNSRGALHFDRTERHEAPYRGPGGTLLRSANFGLLRKTRCRSVDCRLSRRHLLSPNRRTGTCHQATKGGRPDGPPPFESKSVRDRIPAPYKQTYLSLGSSPLRSQMDSSQPSALAASEAVAALVARPW